MDRPDGLAEAMQRLKSQACSDLVKRSRAASSRLPEENTGKQAVDRALARIKEMDKADKPEALEEVKNRMRGIADKYAILKR